jgi:photosynthetic reaction center cytochrome c subunit
MHRTTVKPVAALFAFAGALTFAVAGGHAQSTSAPTQAPAAAAKPKMTQEQFKNIQVLKDLPADQLIPAMQFIAASLGVECEYCHVQGAFDKDDKKPKKTAREMITMMMAINKENFDGHREVTCFTCHRGANDPVGTPIISDAAPKPEAENAAAAAKPLPTADAILDKYLQAVGGREAIEKITSRVEKASLTVPGGPEVPIDIFAKAPDKRISIMHMREGDSITAFDGHQGWLSNPGRPVRPMSEQDNNVAKLDADLHFAADVKQLFSSFQVSESEKIGDREVYLVLGKSEDKPPVRLFFDAESGLLLRMIRYTESPLGRNPSQVDFAHYRAADGVKIPYRWTLARPGQRFTIQVTEVKQNVPVDDAQFATPVERPLKPMYR